ncbi:MAG TPA: hypothetical protein VK306_06510 [Acidimicrobiales bacterium]|nr:hypothetical protein [Acidimicrobiales bacterium]
MRARDLSFDADHLLIRPWIDPVVDQIGHDPRSAYVERFWLGILGPSTTFLLRYLVDRLDAAPDGFDLDLVECATALGLGRLRTPGSAFPRTVGRCCQFGAGRLVGPVTLEVRRRLPHLSLRQVNRLPHSLQLDHPRWLEQAPGVVAATDMRERARRLALSLLELGEDREATERQLHRWRFHPAMTSEATAWAIARHAERQAARTSGAPASAGDDGQTGAGDDGHAGDGGGDDWHADGGGHAGVGDDRSAEGASGHAGDSDDRSAEGGSGHVHDSDDAHSQGGSGHAHDSDDAHSQDGSGHAHDSDDAHSQGGSGHPDDGGDRPVAVAAGADPVGGCRTGAGTSVPAADVGTPEAAAG